jgi:hypothetical protein
VAEVVATLLAFGLHPSVDDGRDIGRRVLFDLRMWRGVNLAAGYRHLVVAGGSASRTEVLARMAPVRAMALDWKGVAKVTVSDVLALLEAERDERGIRNWERLGSGAAGMRSYGIGLTRLRKLAKRIGRDRELAQALWDTDVYDARVIALLVDDPARITRDQAERQVEGLAGGMLAHVFASCDATLAKTPFVVELADEWVRSDDPVRRDCGYGPLYEASKFSGKKAPSEGFFLAHVERIAATIGTESEKVRLAMGSALMGIGKRSAVLNEAALKVARDVGPIEFASASGACEPFDVVKHLTTDRLREKLGV